MNTLHTLLRTSNKRALNSLNSCFSSFNNKPGSSFRKVALGSFFASVFAFYYVYMYQKNTSTRQEKVQPIKTLTGRNEWVKLKIMDIIDESHNAKKFRFALPSENHTIGLEIASALLLKCRAEDGTEIERPYTPISEESAQGYVDLLVKKYDTGKLTPILFNQKKVGDVLEFKGPIPKYKWEPNKHQTIVLLGGGTGITPMYQLIRAIFDNPADKTNVILINCNISEDDILLRKEIDEIQQSFPNRFKAIFILEKPKGSYSKSLPARVNSDLIKKFAPPPGSNTKIFVCGPPGFYDAISGVRASKTEQGPLKGMLAELGYNAEDVFKF